MIFDHRIFSRDELGAWGMSWKDLTLTGLIGGRPVKELTMVADPVPTRLEVAPDATTLRAAERDAVRVIVRGLDQAGSLLPFLAAPVEVRVEGPARLLGPSLLTLVGGTTGFWLESVGKTGAVQLSVRAAGFSPVEMDLEVR